MATTARDRIPARSDSHTPPAPIVTRKRRRGRKPDPATKKSTLEGEGDEEDIDNDQVADAWRYLSPAPNAVQGKQLQKALYPTKEDIAQKKEREAKGKKDAFSIVLEINIEVEITLKARIHGDLTLALQT